MESTQAYLNGEWIESRALRLSPSDLGFAMGVAVSERLRTVGGLPFRQADHIRRLRRSLEIVGWPAAALAAETSSAIDEFVVRNAPYFAPGDDWSISVFITPGNEPDASQPTVCVDGFPLPFDKWAHQFELGVDAVISPIRQIPAACWPPELKCRSRMHYYLADREAQQTIPGARPILLDLDGYVTESSTANVVVYDEQVGLITPELSEVLPGVSQLVLFELADALGVPRSQQRMTPDQLAAADEVFLTSTSISVLPVVRLEGEPIGQGQPGPMYRQLLAAWSEAVGVDLAAQAQKFALR
jgi:branched-subunit amino acid aminotransferase/4-amino-4-deoxychorismate lyase